MAKLVSKLRDSKTIKKVLYISLLFFVFTYIFAVPSFGGRPVFNYVVYALLAVLTMVTVAYMFLYSKFSFNKYLIVILLFPVFGFIGTAIYSHDFRGWLTMLLLAVSLVVLYYDFKLINKKDLIFNIIIAAIFAYSIYFIFHYRSEIIHFSSFGSEAFRLGDYFDNQNGVAMCCIIGVSFSIYQFLFVKGKRKWFYLIPSFSIFLVGLTTGSRTFLLATMLMAILFVFFRLIHHKLLFLFVFALLVLAFIVLINIPFMATLKERIIKMFATFFSETYTFDYSSVSRTIWFDYGFILGGKNMITGYGYAGFSIYSGVGTFTHSNFTEVFCDFGLIGLFIFYAPYVIILIELFKKKSHNINYMLPMVLIFAVLSFSSVFFYDKMYYIFMAACYFITFDDLFVFNNEEYQAKKHFKNTIFVIDENDCDDKTISDIKNKIKQLYPNANLRTIVISKKQVIELETNKVITKKKNYALRLLLLKKYALKNKIDTVVSFDEKQNLLSNSAFSNIVSVHFPIVCDNKTNSHKGNRYYLSSLHIDLFSPTKEDDENYKRLYVENVDDEKFVKAFDTIRKNRYIYENTFNWK